MIELFDPAELESEPMVLAGRLMRVQPAGSARLTFTVPTEPVPMAPPRVAVRAGHAHAHVPAKTAQAAWEIRQCALVARLARDLAGTTAAQIGAPQGAPRAKRAEHRSADRHSAPGEWCSLAADGIEKRRRLPPRTEHVHRRVTPVPQDLGACVLGVCMAVAPNPPNAAPLVPQASGDRVLATLGHLANGLAEPPRHRAARAQPPRSIEKDDGVRALEPEGQRLVVVAIDDPRLASEQDALPVSPLVVRRSHPARPPVVGVEVNHRQPSPCRERTGECALPGPHHPVDEDPVADHPRRTVHGADCATGAEPIAVRRSLSPAKNAHSDLPPTMLFERLTTSSLGRRRALRWPSGRRGDRLRALARQLPKLDRLTAMLAKRPDADRLVETALEGCSPCGWMMLRWSISQPASDTR